MAATSFLAISSGADISMNVTPRIGHMEKRQYNHFHFHGKGDPTPGANEADCHYCQLMSFSTHKNVPVSIVLDPSGTRIIPKDFKFIEETIFTGVKLADGGFLSGCSCADGSQCMTDQCTCMQDTVQRSIGGKINAYHAAGERKGCLRGEILNSRWPIYECNSGCSCGEKCPNRVVGAGRKVDLQIFPTKDNRGWGT